MIYYSSCLNLLPGKPHIFSLIFLLMNSNHVSTVSNHSLPFPFLWQYKQTINQLREKIPCIQRTRQEMINFCFQQVKHVQISKDTLHYIFFCFRPRKMMSIFVFTVAVTILFTSVNSALIHKSKVSLRHPVDIWWYSNYLPSMTDASNFILRKMTLACMDKMPGCRSLPRNLVFANILW